MQIHKVYNYESTQASCGVFAYHFHGESVKSRAEVSTQIELVTCLNCLKSEGQMDLYWSERKSRLTHPADQRED